MSDKLEDGDELWNINISKTEGSRDVAAPDVLIDPMSQPLKIKKVNDWDGREPNIRKCWGLLGRADHGKNHLPTT